MSDELRSRRVYVAGPMTSLPELNFPAFHRAAAELRARGAVVFNPAELNFGPLTEWTECMRACLRGLSHCDAIVMLPGWEASRGAKLEHHVATTLGLRVLLAANGLPSEVLEGVA